MRRITSASRPPNERQHPGLRDRAHRGFTLTELLVVMACVVLLLALALPAVGKVLKQSRGTQCSANLRQMHAAATAYSSTYADRLPPAILYFKRAAGIETAAWDWVQSPGGVVTPGALWLFSGNPERVQQCPEFLGASTFGNDPFTGYNYNTTFIGAEGTFPQYAPDGTLLDGWKTARLGLPASALRRTSETALFADGGWKGGANKFMRAPLNTVEENLSLIYAGGQAFRHSGGCNCVYLDGHCASPRIAREGVHATPQLLGAIMAFPSNGFLSDDDSAYDPR